jgi:hypothetical protein
MPDYMVGNAPNAASYNPPRVDFSWLGDLPKDYYMGRAIRRQDALATAFPQGMQEFYDPRTGSYDFAKMTNRIMSIGGPDAAKDYLGLMYKGQLGSNIAGSTPELPGGSGDSYGAGSTGSGFPSRGDSIHTGPANMRGSQAAQPGYDSQGDNITSLVTEHLPGVDNPKLIQYLANQAFPGDPDGASRTLTGDQATKIVQTITAYKQKQSQSASLAGPPGPSVSSISPALGPTPQTGGQPAAQPGPQAAPSGPGAIGGQPGPGPAPAGNYAQNAGAAGTVPPQFSDRARALLVDAFNNQRKRAAGLSLVDPVEAKNAQVAMEAINKRIEAIDAFNKARLEPTTEQKNVRDPLANPARIEGQKLEIAAGQKMLSGIVAADKDASTNQHYIDAGRSALQDPRYGGGLGSDINQFFGKLRAAFGSDPNANLANEILTKTTAQSVLNQTSQFRENMGEMGANSGRIFQQQIQLMLDSSASLKGTPAGSRALLTIQERAGQYQNKIHDMAQAYLDAQEKAGVQYPHLDRKFDKQVSQFLRDNPMFSKQELTNINLLASHHYGSAADAGTALGEGQTYWNTAKKSYQTTRRANGRT